MSALWTCQARSVLTRVSPAEIAPDTAGVTVIPHASAMLAQDSRETNAQTALLDFTEMAVPGSALVKTRALRMDAAMPWAFASATEDLQGHPVTRAVQTCLGSNVTFFVKMTRTALATGPAAARACANATKAGLELRVTSVLLAPSPSWCLSTSLSMSPGIVMRRKPTLPAMLPAKEARLTVILRAIQALDWSKLQNCIHVMPHATGNLPAARTGDALVRS
jgi:hypothetical protein